MGDVSSTNMRTEEKNSFSKFHHLNRQSGMSQLAVIASISPVINSSDVIITDPKGDILWNKKK